jgi:hypothetical protein
VHGAVLRNGARVVLKVQYPEVEELFKDDLNTVATFCRYLQPEFTPIMEEMERRFMTEFDFAREGIYRTAPQDTAHTAQYNTRHATHNTQQHTIHAHPEDITTAATIYHTQHTPLNTTPHITKRTTKNAQRHNT